MAASRLASAGAKHALILAFVPLSILLLYIWNPVWRIYSDHGFMHQSIVYRLMSGEFPPTSPIFAGQNLLYLWGHHYLVAALAQLTNFPLSWLFAILNLVALVAALFLAYRFGQRLRGNALDGLFAALLAVVSCNAITRGPLVDLLTSGLEQAHFPYRLWQYTALVIAKFYNLNSNGLGVAAVLAWLLGSLAYLQGSGKRPLLLTGIALSALAVGFLYPVYTLNLAATAAILFGVTFVGVVKGDRTATFLLAAATAVGLALTVPYILSVSAGRTTPAITLSDLHWILHKSMILSVAVIVPAALIFFNRALYLRLVRERPTPWAMLGIFAAVAALLWALLNQSNNEYKHLLILTVALGLAAAPGLTDFYARSRAGALALLALVLLPFVSDWLDLMHVSRWPAFQPVVERGATLQSADAADDQLYAWIRTQTRPDDAFIDDRLLIPVLGQRSLYVGLDAQTRLRKAEAARLGEEVNDGWEWRPQDLLLQQGYAAGRIAARERLSKDLLGGGRSTTGFDSTVTGNIYLVARAAPLRESLAGQSGSKRVFASPAADVYLVRSRL